MSNHSDLAPTVQLDPSSESSGSSEVSLPILAIVGPTATGKSEFALQLIEVLKKKWPNRWSGFDIISADSRQVYHGMEIGSGSDVPAHFVRSQLTSKDEYAFFSAQNVSIHGISIISPRSDWSVAHFQKMVQDLYQKAIAQKRLVILVGGTGLYHQQLQTTDPQLHIPPNEELREQAATYSLPELQAWLAKVAPAKWEELNSSDRQNPRRLVRAIEIAVAKAVKAEQLEHELSPGISQETVVLPPILQIGLRAPLELIAQRVAERVKNRVKQGIIEEVTTLLASYDDENWKLPAFSATGYQELRQYLTDILTLEQALELWTRREVQYAKRQVTWWKKQQSIEWFDITQPDWEQAAYRSLFAKLH